MKKMLSIILSILIVSCFTSCGEKNNSSVETSEVSNSVSSTVSTSEDSSETDTSSEETHSLDELSGLNVDQKLFDVEITIPADFVEEGMTQADLDQEVEEAGFQSAVLNEDGSVTYVMTKDQHQKMMEEMKSSLDQSLSEMIDPETFPTFQNITSNDDYTEFTVQISSSEIGFAEGMSVLGFYMISGVYHAFNGTQPDDIVVKFVDADGNVIDESHSSELGEE
ncbi:MAG: hypothetical protein ACOX6P_10460 [Candidatus Merdivicinus sp.]|jgi:hypothetical protein